MRRKNQRGQTMPLILLLAFVAIVAVVLLLWLGIGAGMRAKAQAGADAAALAGAAEGELAAKQTAERNHVTLTRFETLGTDVRVIVRIRNVSATARARNELPTSLQHLPPVFRATLARAAQLHGSVPVVHSVSKDAVVVDEKTAQWLAPLEELTGLHGEGETFSVIRR